MENVAQDALGTADATSVARNIVQIASDAKGMPYTMPRIMLHKILCRLVVQMEMP